MDTVDRLFFAFLIAGAAAWIFSALWSEWRRRRLLGRLAPHLGAAGEVFAGGGQKLDEVCRRVAAGMQGCVLTAPTQFQLLHRGLRGRCDFISDKTEIRMDTGDLIQQVVEVVPSGFWASRSEPFRARGSVQEYARLFSRPPDEGVLREIGAPYELRLSPDGMTLRIHSLPENAAALGHWISCAFRLVDHLPGVEGLGRVQVTDVKNQATDEAMCQVCGAALTGAPVVRCASCSTLHHADCWDYAKKCSTFGCTSDRCVQ